MQMWNNKIWLLCVMFGLSFISCNSDKRTNEVRNLNIYKAGSVQYEKVSIEKADELTDEFIAAAEHQMKSYGGRYPDTDLVPDSNAALLIADVIFTAVYGDSIREQAPYRCRLVGDSSWLVYGNAMLKPSRIGGTVFTKIRKSDGRILYLFQSK